jgi:DNA-binding GntR family transcriptional regulator
MRAIKPLPSLTAQVYQAILDEICDGALPSGTHLVQEELADRLDVSRHPVQQAMALLKADGIVEEVGKRGLCVAKLDLGAMRHHYDIRAALDGLAARGAAQRAKRDSAVAADIEQRGRAILAAGEAAVADAVIPRQIRQEEAFHNLIYDASGNPLLSRTAEPHWRFLRRAMGDVLRYAETPPAIWRQHAEILDAIVMGDPKLAEKRAVNHILVAADTLEKRLKDHGAVSTEPATPA